MAFYDLLLRLYPASFRHEYGGEMRALFRRRRQQTSVARVPVLWMTTIGEVVANATAVHLEILRHDVAYTARMLRRAPGFGLTAVLVVALGIGATTAAFSVTDFVLIRPLPFPEPDRLVKIWEKTPGYSRMEFSIPNYTDWIGAAKSYESTGVYADSKFTMTISGEPQRMIGGIVSAGVFPTLRVTPIIGRSFSPDDDRVGAPGTIVLSYRLWQTVFGADPGIVGRSLVLDTGPYTVIGVMARTFNFPSSDFDFWVAFRQSDTDRTNNMWNCVGRLRPGVTLAQARAEIEVIAAQSAKQYPAENKDTSGTVIALRDEVSQRSRLLLWALSGAAGCVLLIACANLANLLVARALSRRRELALRTAIGAGRERLVRQLMTESLLLAAVGGAFGIGIATSAVPLLAQLVPSTLPTAAEPSVDVRVLFVAVALTALTGIGFGLAPVLRVGVAPNLDGLRDGSRSGGGQKERLRSILVVTEIVASVVLLVSAGLLIRALLTVQATDPGFKVDNVLTMQTALPFPQYRAVASREAFYKRVLDDVRALPGVKSAGYISYLPISSFRGGIWPVSVPGDAGAGAVIRSGNNSAVIRYVTPGYFEAMQIPIKRGRDIGDADGGDRQFVAVVSESFVRRYWPNDDPLGRHFTFAAADREVVGVAGDVRHRGLERVSEPQVYLSSKQVPDGNILGYIPKDLAIRTAVAPQTLAPAVRAIVRSVDPKLAITNVQTLADMVDLDTASRSVQVRVLSAFALIAFVLAAVGIHGLLSFAVTQRIAEFGVRMALGAQPADILRMVVRDGVRLAIAGVIPGIALAYAAARSMQALLAGVPPADIVTFGSVAALAVAMTVIGTIAPAVRALRVDPITAIRTE